MTRSWSQPPSITCSLWVGSPLFLNVISRSCYFRSSVTLPTWRVKSSHTPQCSPEWELGHWGTKAKRGLWTWNDSPTLKCKTLLPQHSTGLLPPLICRKWLESETMSLTPSSQPLKLAQHAVSGQSGRESLLNRGISPRKAGFCLFLLQQAIIKQWGVNSFPPPCVLKCGPWSLTPILMRYFKLSHLALGDLWVPSNSTWESKC